MRVTVPDASDLISLNSFIASMRPRTCPEATSSPAATYGRAPGDGAEYQTPVRGALTNRMPGAGSPKGVRPSPPVSLPGTATGAAAGVGAGAGAAATGRANRTRR